MEKWLFQRFFGNITTVSFRVTYWDGTSDTYGSEEPRFTILFREKIPVSEFLKNPSMAFGEGYMSGAIDLEGDLEDILRAAYANRETVWRQTLARIPKAVSIRKQKENVQRHYDLGNAFYALWLDETMSYSCAYFRNPSDSLEQAQLQKIDHVLRKLQLRPGETLLDIGSGWGWLIIRAAQQYGVNAWGITLSEEQLRETRKRISASGLEGKVEVDLLDYRELAHTGRRFDKIASVGMFEHVGQAQYPDFMKTVQTLLGDGGLMLLHTITHAKEEPTDPWIDKYIFPGGYVPSLREIVHLLPEYGFEVIDVESLRMHYAMTLDHWAERFERHVDTVRAMYGERFVRMWRLYLRSSAASFRNGGLNIHQILFSKGRNNELHLTREHLYHR